MRRVLSAWAVRTAVAVVVAATATRLSVSAFVGVGTAAFSASHARPLSTELFGGEGAPEDGPKLLIETITDENLHAVLRPPSSPDRPVLVDVFAPWCGPCKLLDKVLKKAYPRYVGKVNFCKWNVNDKENTGQLRELLLGGGHTLSKLPSLVVFREGKLLALRTGLANEFQLDDFLERTLPDVLERTFDEHGLKMLPLPEDTMVQKEEEKRTLEGSIKVACASNLVEGMMDVAVEASLPPAVTGEVEKAGKLVVEEEIWQNRTVAPAMDGILLPSRSYGRH